MNMRFRTLSYGALALTAASVGAGCEDAANNTGGATTATPTLLQIQTLSNRADHVSGGDVMVQILLPPDAAPSGLHVRVGDRDVTSEFAAREDGRILGVIHGLAEGDNKVIADVDGAHTVSLTVTNHSLGGPVFSGERVVPFVCATPTAQVQVGDTPATNASGLNSLAVAGDDNCNLKTEVKLFYRSSDPACVNGEPDPSPPATPPLNPCFKPYDPNGPVPVDLKMIARGDAMVPYIVRDERGTVNRGIYDIAVLFDPKADPVATGWKPFAPQKGWNGKVVYSFGANSGQPRQQ
ncbi:MAG TPA: DUF6351 family protein, partial [Kofleriaceae bacterium]|nr:DUF6351 family protein [Kofleriaceae bacterium]